MTSPVGVTDTLVEDLRVLVSLAGLVSSREDCLSLAADLAIILAAIDQKSGRGAALARHIGTAALHLRRGGGPTGVEWASRLAVKELSEALTEACHD